MAARRKGPSAIAGVSIEIPLLDELIKDFKVMPTDLKRSLQRTVNKVGNEILVPYIKNSVIPGQGLVGKSERPDGSVRKGYRPGTLQRGIRAKARNGGLEGVVEARAFARGNRHSMSGGGYPYGARYEFGGRGEDTAGPRAFLQPAIQAKGDEIAKAMDEDLYQVLLRHGW